MQKKAVLLHINAFVSVTPLVGGYLKAYALTEPEIRNHWDIELYSTFLRTPASEIIQYLFERQPDVVGFSAYTWNVGLIKRLLPALRAVLPATTRFILGGVEVGDRGRHYIQRHWENVSICNGEGEQTFHDYLLQLSGGRPDFEQVPGLGFYQDGVWVNTERAARIRALDQVPSPWLGDLFSGHDMSEIALFETNRGCPFACEFCHWGGAIGAKVNRQELQRVKDEISYIARKRCRTLILCDANFGILPRDQEIAEHIASVKRRHHAPARVTFNAAKNRVERVESIAKVFVEAGLLNAQTISLQSLNPRAMELAKRSNIKSDAYLRLQERLNEWGVASYIELIWPLPGETLASFKQGVGRLCGMGAQSFCIYPLLWLNNVGYQAREQELGVALLEEDDPVGGATMVIQTNEVSYPEYIEGMGFSTAVILLHNCRGLYMSMQLLNHLGVATFEQVLASFADWMDRGADDPVSALWQDGKVRFEKMSKNTWRGAVGYAALHTHREAFDQLLTGFADHHPEWFGQPGPNGELLRAALEFDLLSRPYLYLQTPLAVHVDLTRLAIVGRRRSLWVVASPYDFAAMLPLLRGGRPLPPALIEPAPVTLAIDHRLGLSFHRPDHPEIQYHWSCYQSVLEVGKIEARYRTIAGGYNAVGEPGGSGRVRQVARTLGT